MHRIIETLATAKAENRARRELMAQNIAVQQGLKEQIRSINLAIQQQVMSNELLNQNHMAETLTRAVSTTNSGTDPGQGAGATGTVSTQP
jgi:TolA-binding protein